MGHRPRPGRADQPQRTVGAARQEGLLGQAVAVAIRTGQKALTPSYTGPRLCHLSPTCRDDAPGGSAERIRRWAHQVMLRGDEVGLCLSLSAGASAVL